MDACKGVFFGGTVFVVDDAHTTVQELGTMIFDESCARRLYLVWHGLRGKAVKNPWAVNICRGMRNWLGWEGVKAVASHRMNLCSGNRAA